MPSPLHSLLIIFFLFWSELLHASISSFPRRVIIDSHQQTATLTLTHQGNKTTRYRISFIDMAFDKNEQLKKFKSDELPDNYYSAKSFLRYSPRQITLAPGESQTVRILARKKRSLPKGEYRSYIHFQELPNKKNKNNIEQLINSNKKNISIKPKILMGLALPIIVYQGKLEGSAETKSLTLEHPTPDKTVAKFNLFRYGNRSLYGEVVAEQNGKIVGIAKGLALYTPYEEQTFSVNLDPAKLQSGKKLTVTYRGLNRDAGTIFATGEIIVP